jgi:hypothetical protein
MIFMAREGVVVLVDADWAGFGECVSEWEVGRAGWNAMAWGDIHLNCFLFRGLDLHGKRVCWEALNSE